MNREFAGRDSLSDDHQVPGRIYSVGYEGFEVSSLIEHLAYSKVSLVVDVRLTPQSRSAVSRERHSLASCKRPALTTATNRISEILETTVTHSAEVTARKVGVACVRFLTMDPGLPCNA